MKWTIENEQFICFSYLLVAAWGMAGLYIICYYFWIDDWKLLNLANDECGDVELTLVLISSCYIFHLLEFLSYAILQVFQFKCKCTKTGGAQFFYQWWISRQVVWKIAPEEERRKLMDLWMGEVCTRQPLHRERPTQWQHGRTRVLVYGDLP